jgi:hypothetical protein
VVVVIVLNDVRPDVLVGLGSSGGAIYVMMFDARRNCAALAANGYMGHDTAGSS